MTRILILIFILAFSVFEIRSQTIAQESFSATSMTLPMALHNYAGEGIGWGGNWYTQNEDVNVNGYIISDANPMVHSDAPDPGPYLHGQNTFLSTGRYFDALGAFQDYAVAENGPIGVGTFYFSFLIRKEVDDDNAVEVIFSDATGQPWQTPDQLIEIGYLGTASNDMGGTRYWSLAAFNETVFDQSDSAIVIGRTYQIIIEVAFGTTSTINMWVNPIDGNPDFSTPDASISTTEDLSFWNVALLFDNTTASFDEFIFSEDLGTVLPVEYGGFTANKRDHMVELRWSTITEISNDYFLVERSLDGKLWNPIGKVSGFGDSNQLINYTFLDQSPQKGFNYYRLKQVDYDGDSDISKIIGVNFSVDLDREVIIHMKNDELEFLSTEVINELLIFDLQGSLITHQFPNKNLFSLELARKETMYIAIIKTESRTWRQKFLAN